MERIELQERALVLMYRKGEVKLKKRKERAYNGNGTYLGEVERIYLKSIDKDVEPTNENKQPITEAQQGFD